MSGNPHPRWAADDHFTTRAIIRQRNRARWLNPQRPVTRLSQLPTLASWRHRRAPRSGVPRTDYCVENNCRVVASQATVLASPKTGVGMGMTRPIDIWGERIWPRTRTGPSRSRRLHDLGSALTWAFTTWLRSETWPLTWRTDFCVSRSVRSKMTVPCWKLSRVGSLWAASGQPGDAQCGKASPHSPVSPMRTLPIAIRSPCHCSATWARPPSAHCGPSSWRHTGVSAVIFS